MKIKRSYTFNKETVELLDKLKEYKDISRTKVLEQLILKESVKLGLEE